MDFVWWKKIKLLPGATDDTIYTEIQYDQESKQIVNFVVIQLYEHNRVVYEIKKHDCAHGKYHVHHYYEGIHSKVIETTEPVAPELFRNARKDILENWFNYRMRYVRKYLNDPLN